jgi:hypothetical protein
MVVRCVCECMIACRQLITSQLLLGYKQRGFGADLCVLGAPGRFKASLLKHDRYNGFGGKPEPGETMRDCAIRELEVRS